MVLYGFLDNAGDGTETNDFFTKTWLYNSREVRKASKLTFRLCIVSTKRKSRDGCGRSDFPSLGGTHCKSKITHDSTHSIKDPVMFWCSDLWKIQRSTKNNNGDRRHALGLRCSSKKVWTCAKSSTRTAATTATISDVLAYDDSFIWATLDRNKQ